MHDHTVKAYDKASAFRIWKHDLGLQSCIRTNYNTSGTVSFGPQAQQQISNREWLKKKRNKAQSLDHKLKRAVHKQRTHTSPLRLFYNLLNLELMFFTHCFCFFWVFLAVLLNNDEMSQDVFT